MIDTMLPRGTFCGDAVSSRDVRGLTLTDYTYRPALRIAPHRHETAYLSIVLTGGYEESLQSGERTCRAGTVTFHLPNEQHADRFGAEGARIFTIEFEPRWLEAVPMLDRPATFNGGPVASLMLRASAELARMDDVSPLAIEGLAYEMLAEAVRGAKGSAPRWLERARAVVAERFRERLTLESIAAEAGVHPAHLTREFRRHYGTTIGDAIRARRVEAASHALAFSAEPIARIALDAGFANQSHFSAAFRRVTGMSPARYRRALRS
ncbi:MAG TPA: AraC family transcriptional regulator [Thermoanaerobaculia bacterium]|nr:AraC family transcriptional regulator [Thermoanaerobaculia bacterium]